MPYDVEERTQRRFITRNGGQKPIEIRVRQYRRKEILISLLGIVSLSTWSDWEDIPEVDENENPI